VLIGNETGPADASIVLMLSMLSMLPKDIIWLIDGILHHHRMGMILDEYQSMLRTDDDGGSIGFRGLSYNFRSFNEQDWSDDDPVYDKHGLEVAPIPKNYYRYMISDT
jgi:hypothetical protein